MILNKKWEKVTLEKTKDTGIIYLDSKELKSPEGRSLNLPYSISEKVFIEWKEIKDKIYPDKMPFYAYSVTAVDKILNKENKILQNLESILSMDLILFRSKDDEELYNYIEDLWEPFLEWINLEFNCRLIVNYELFSVEQNKNEISKCISLVKHFDHFNFSGFSHIVNLTSSFILGLAFLYKKINVHDLYKLALAEELFQIKKWGSDEISEARRKNIKKEISEACEFLNCLQKK